MAKFGLFSFLLLSLQCFGFVPTVNQIVRFQPARLNNEKSFSVSGMATFHINETQTEKLGYQLDWVGPQNYQLTISSVPNSAYKVQGAKRWIIQRQGTSCRLMVDPLVVACAEAGVWALSELVGDAEKAAQGFYRLGLIEKPQTQFKETNKNHATPSGVDQGVHFALAKNQGRASAWLELRGFNSTEDAGRFYPSARFEQNYLSIMDFVSKVDGINFEILASKTWPELKEGRQVHILSENFTVTTNGKTVLSVQRKKNPTNTAPAKLALMNSNSPVETLKGQMTDAGWNLISSLLLTH